MQILLHLRPVCTVFSRTGTCTSMPKLCYIVHGKFGELFCVSTLCKLAHIIHNKRGRKNLTAKTEMENMMFYACCKNI